MKKLYIYLLIIAAIVVLVFTYLKYRTKSDLTPPPPPAAEENALFEFNTNPIEGALPDLNPIDKTNPFIKYENPFE